VCNARCLWFIASVVVAPLPAQKESALRSRKLSPRLTAAVVVALFTSCTAILATAQAASSLIGPTTPVFTSLFAFDMTNGAYPGSMSLVQGTDGNFYGVTDEGGTSAFCTYSNGCGTFFQITSEGVLTTLYSFCELSGCADGEFPSAGVVQGADGNFYGVAARGGGSTDNGTVFKITPAGVLTTLHAFLGTDGADPLGRLIWFGGNLYGTTYGQGSTQTFSGTVFKVTPSGVLTTLYAFCSQPACADGSFPDAGLVQASDGNFYGTTSQGGVAGPCPQSGYTGCGTIFRITPGGTLTTVHSFAGDPSDGGFPGNLIQGTDLNLYGTTFYGGDGGGDGGTAFKTTLDGSFTLIHNFCSKELFGKCLDGSIPTSIIQATNGDLYGTAEGGTNGNGLIYQLTTKGKLIVEHDFDQTDGANPYAGVVQGTDGSFYGSTQNGGPEEIGSIYKLNTGLAPFIETQTISGKVGSPVTILGTNLTGATSVAFNGTAATFTVVSGSLIKATVPAGATSGLVIVTTTTATLKSNTKFKVTH
jgi:uncharacterized repeat protein (TIGR03803 family)